MVRVFLLISLLIMSLGCSRTMTESEYAISFKAASERFFAVTNEIAEASLPDKTGLSKSEQLKALAEHVRTQNSKVKGLIPEISELRPPPKFEGLHKTYLELLEGQTKRDDEYAAALESDDRALADQLSNEFYDFQQSQMLKVVDEIERAGGDVSQLRESFRQMMKEQS